MNVRARLGFGFGNLIAAALLGAALSALPVRFWLVDALLAIVAVLLVISSVGLCANLPWGRLGLRVAASALLTLGLFLVGIALLTVAFLSGAHGRWLEWGIPVSVLALALFLPYAVLYPLAQLVWSRREGGAPA